MRRVVKREIYMKLLMMGQLLKGLNNIVDIIIFTATKCLRMGSTNGRQRSIIILKNIPTYSLE